MVLISISLRSAAPTWFPLQWESGTGSASPVLLCALNSSASCWKQSRSDKMTFFCSSPTVLQMREWQENLSGAFGEWLVLCVGDWIPSCAGHEIEREMRRIGNILVLQLLPAFGNEYVRELQVFYLLSWVIPPCCSHLRVWSWGLLSLPPALEPGGCISLWHSGSAACASLAVDHDSYGHFCFMGTERRITPVIL